MEETPGLPTPPPAPAPTEPVQPVASQPPQPAAPPPPRKTSTVLLLVVFGILLLAALGAGAFYLGQTSQPVPTPVPSPISFLPSPTPEAMMEDDLSNWQTYQVNGTPYAFKYPPEAVVSGAGDWTFFMINGATLQHMYSGNKGNQNLEQFVQNYQVWNQAPTQSPLQVDAKEQITINGILGYKVKSGVQTYYFLQYDQTGEVVVFHYETVDSATEAIFIQIISTLEFVESQVGGSEEQGADLGNIGYTLPATWKAEIQGDSLLLTADGGGYFSIKVYNYPGTGRREYFCQVTGDICVPETYFTVMNIGNISGYKADGLDNSGGGPVYFGAKGDKFYIINSYSPPAPSEFANTYQQVLDSFVF
ncbi:hypothetical protein C4579_04045 [Candidatus Microgenomates bacterium]|nr:MAG: hypothetical protein C4579_04045 [Candidatus Microgenomates bacterium]